MENEGEKFEQLRKLLALKRHEQPPPGYFNHFSSNVVAQIRAERNAGKDSFRKLSSEAPWLIRFWQAMEGKPVFAGACGAAICSLVLAGIYFSEKPEATPDFSATARQNSPFVAAAPDPGGSALDQPLMLAATNQNGVAPLNLFDLVQPLQAAPVSASPAN